MTQEVRVVLQLTLEVGASLSKNEIQRKLEIILKGHSFEALISYPDQELIRAEITQIEEEAEIYGTEGADNPGLQEYIKKYNIDVKRQTKLDL